MVSRTSKQRVMVNLDKGIHAKLVQAQALMTLERKKKVSLEKVIERLTEKYIQARRREVSR